MRRIDLIVVHTTATRENSDIGAKEIRDFHVNVRGWSDIGYHYIIRLDGTIEHGRPEAKQGAHVRGYNRNSIGISYIGGIDKDTLAPKDTRTDAQRVAMVCLLKDLKKNYPKAKIVGHRDLSPDLNGNGVIEPFEWTKQCPCFNATEEYKDI